jgi:hypothetical protein
MSKANDSRVRELRELKLALATFALQLDAFEQRARSVLLSIGHAKDGGRDYGPQRGPKIAGQ